MARNAGGRRSERAALRFTGPCHDVTPWSTNNRVTLCQATLSIGLYLLLEGAVPTTLLYPSSQTINLVLVTTLACWLSKRKRGVVRVR